MGIGRGHGKLLLFGEHAAVYGYPAVGLRLDDYLEVEIVCAPPVGPERSAKANRHTGWIIPELDPREASLVHKALEALPYPVTQGELRIRGTLPMGVGFGSSAAFCIGLLRAGGFSGDPNRLWTAAHRMEHVFHGTPSGIDTGLSIHEGASIVYPHPPGLPTREPVPLPRAWIVFGAIPRTHPTAELVAGIRSLRKHQPERVERTLEHLGDLSSSAARPDRCPDAAAFGALADEAHSGLQSLGLSTGEMETVLARFREAGALGAKLSGAGGGGAFYAVFRTEAEARAAISRVRPGTGVRLLHLGVTAVGAAAGLDD